MEKRDGSHETLAVTQVRLVRCYSPNAGAALESIYPYGAEAVCRAALVILLFKGALERSGKLPLRFKYEKYLQDRPEVIPLLDHALKCLIQDWQYGNVQSDDGSAQIS